MAITAMIISTGMTMTTRRERERSAIEFRAAARDVRLSDPRRKTARALDESGLYRLLAWLSPAYPVGAFSYSSGIEWAVEAGDIIDAATLRSWIGSLVAVGSVFCDAVLFVHAHQATEANDGRALRDVADLAAALSPSKERHLETTAQGRAFLDVTRAAWSPEAGVAAVIGNDPIAYPVAVGAVCAWHRVALKPALHGFLHAVVANLISAGVRLIPLGQTDGQRSLAALESSIAAAAAKALATPLDDIGGAAFRADIASMKHEAQYTRLFRS
jgi:urease accessory protein